LGHTDGDTIHLTQLLRWHPYLFLGHLVRTCLEPWGAGTCPSNVVHDLQALSPQTQTYGSKRRHRFQAPIVTFRVLVDWCVPQGNPSARCLGLPACGKRPNVVRTCLRRFRRSHDVWSPNKALQRSWTHKVLARGRLISSSTQGALARTTCRRAAAELCR
jgi:hypothetical protein